MRPDFYDDTRFCPQCEVYVRYLSAPGRTYCIHCSGEVNLFSAPDRARFQSSLGHRGFADERDSDGGYDEPGGGMTRRSA